MTREDMIEELQSRVRKGKIATLDDLKLEISCAEYDGEEPIDEYEDIIIPMEWNTCDLCGALSPTEEMCWVDYLDYDEDKDLIEEINLRGEDICAICWDCVKEILRKGD